MMQGRIHAIYISAFANGPLTLLRQAHLEAGRGIVGDRYYNGNGTFSELLADKPLKDLTLIEKEAVDAFNRQQGLALSYAGFRRNIITRDIRLNELVDRAFYLGNVRLRGIMLCEPCPHLASVLHEKVMPEMLGKSGLRAQILSSDRISINDIIQTASTAQLPGDTE